MNELGETVLQMEKHSESDVEEWAIKNTAKIEKGLRYIGRQIDLKEYGRLDVLCKDSKGRFAIIELKRPDEIIDESILSQVFRYRTGLMEKKEYRIQSPTDIRILCFVNKIDSTAKKICEQAGIGIATYDLKEVNFPEETVGELPKTELRHGVLPVSPIFFRKLDKYCFFDTRKTVNWMRPGSLIVFYSEKKLKAECKVVEIDRKFKSTDGLNHFLRKIGYISKPADTLYSTLITHEGLTHYRPPVWWESYLRKFRPHAQFYPESPMAIDDIELAWIRGEQAG